MLGKGLTVVGALVLLAAMFLDWYGFKITGTTLGGARSVDAWGAFQWLDMLMVVAVVSALTSVALGARVPVLGAMETVTAVAVLSAALIAYRWIDPPVEAGSTGFATVEIAVRAGLPIGLTGALLIAGGGAAELRRRP